MTERRQTAWRGCGRRLFLPLRGGGWNSSPVNLRSASRGSLGPGRGTCVGRTLLEGKIVHIHDTYEDPEYELEISKLKGFRSQLGVPLLRETTPIGVIVLTRLEVRPFTEEQIDLARPSLTRR
jgi:GAF domain-containing protein